jgi:hypothetical protein
VFLSRKCEELSLTLSTKQQARNQDERPIAFNSTNFPHEKKKAPLEMDRGSALRLRLQDGRIVSYHPNLILKKD